MKGCSFVPAIIRRLLAAGVCCLALLALLGTAGGAQPPHQTAVPVPPSQTCSWLARPVGESTSSIAELAGQAGLTARYIPALNLWELKCAGGSTGEGLPALRRLAESGAFEWLIPNRRVTTAAEPNDPGYAAQWNMRIIQAPAAWDITTGSRQVLIAVLDTGISLSHPDLQANLWQNTDEIAGNGIDDDSNGYVDDRWGWNFAAGTPNPDDDHWHGTHVAGIAGAVGSNAVGVAGTAWQVQLMAVKFLDHSGQGTFLDMLQAMRYAADNGARILNLSVSVDGDLTAEERRLLDEAVNYVKSRGAIMVAASGNAGASKPAYPARHPDIMAIGASTSSDERWWLSNYGPELDLLAPGAGIYSTSRASSGPTYSTASGTSMAAPHVSGTAALLWAANPGLTPAEVMSILRLSADDVNYADYPGPDVYCGWGRLNLRRAVQAAVHGAVLQAYAGAGAVPALGAPITITAVLMDLLGAPAPDGTAISFSTDLGTVLPAEAYTAGGTAVAQFIPGEAVGSARITVRAGALTEQIAVTVQPGPPATLQLALEKEVITAGTPAVPLTVTVQDAAGNPVQDGTVVLISAQRGSAAPALAYTYRGMVHSTYQPPTAAGPDRITAQVSSGISQTLTVSIVPGPPARLHWSFEPAFLRAGETHIPFSVQVRDAYDNPAPDGLPVAFASSQGEVQPAVVLIQGGTAAAALTGTLSRGEVCLQAHIDTLAGELCRPVIERMRIFPLLFRQPAPLGN
ncbi:MAG: S8 family serine peptidase [Anaerolineae bacterium]